MLHFTVNNAAGSYTGQTFAATQNRVFTHCTSSEELKHSLHATHVQTSSPSTFWVLFTGPVSVIPSFSSSAVVTIRIVIIINSLFMHLFIHCISGNMAHRVSAHTKRTTRQADRQENNAGTQTVAQKHSKPTPHVMNRSE